ncbi:MAG: helix-turn-helix domain-containing protein, partial [Bacteroidota bacterium]
IGPLIYLYLKSIANSNFVFKKKHILHFIPVTLYVCYRVFIFAYDAQQPGFNDHQNGILMEHWAMGPVGTFTDFFTTVQMLLYLAFSLQLYFVYRIRIMDYFSNTYRLELNWIRNFLYIYSFLFLYATLQDFVNLSVMELSWIEKWWYQFFSALAVIYIGIKGYFTDTSRLEGLDFSTSVYYAKLHKSLEAPSGAIPNDIKYDLKGQTRRLAEFMKRERPYLKPDLNLKEMARELKISRGQLSEIINLGFGKNFNDFINQYRVETVKNMIMDGKHGQLSLLGIAYESGFNSKATFNRVFKKMTHNSPSEFLKTLKRQ